MEIKASDVPGLVQLLEHYIGPIGVTVVIWGAIILGAAAAVAFIRLLIAKGSTRSLKNVVTGLREQLNIERDARRALENKAPDRPSIKQPAITLGMALAGGQAAEAFLADPVQMQKENRAGQLAAVVWNAMWPEFYRCNAYSKRGER